MAQAPYLLPNGWLAGTVIPSSCKTGQDLLSIIRLLVFCMNVLGIVMLQVLVLGRGQLLV